MGFLQDLRGEFLLAERAVAMFLTPSLDALGVEVMALVAGQRSHQVIQIEILQTDAAFLFVIELVRREDPR